MWGGWGFEYGYLAVYSSVISWRVAPFNFLPKINLHWSMVNSLTIVTLELVTIQNCHLILSHYSGLSQSLPYHLINKMETDTKPVKQTLCQVGGWWAS